MIKLIILTLAAAALGAPDMRPRGPMRFETSGPGEYMEDLEDGRYPAGPPEMLRVLEERRVEKRNVLGSFEDVDARYFENLAGLLFLPAKIKKDQPVV